MFNPSELGNFTCTEQYYFNPLFPKMKYTDGVQFIGANGAGWLVDKVGSYQYDRRLKNEELQYFQLWKLEKCADGKWLLTCRQDTGMAPVISETIDFSDFPIDNFEWYVIDGVMLLKSEY